MKLFLLLLALRCLGYFFGFVAKATFEDIDPIRELNLYHDIDIDSDLSSLGPLAYLVQEVLSTAKAALLAFFKVPGILMTTQH
jgi:hypothetical protein